MRNYNPVLAASRRIARQQVKHILLAILLRPGGPHDRTTIAIGISDLLPRASYWHQLTRIVQFGIIADVLNMLERQNLARSVPIDGDQLAWRFENSLQSEVC